MKKKTSKTIYEELSKPFENEDLANKALENFYKDMQKLRIKYKIPDVSMAIIAKTKYPNGNIGEFMYYQHGGNIENAEKLTAYAFGKAQEKHREYINILLSETKK